jgi:hypothetical protein
MMKKIRFGLGFLLIFALAVVGCGGGGGSGSYEDFENMLNELLEGTGAPNNTALSGVGLDGKNFSSVVNAKGYRGWGYNTDGWLMLVWTGLNSAEADDIISEVEIILSGTYILSDEFYWLNYGTGKSTYDFHEEEYTSGGVLFPPGLLWVDFTSLP